MATYGFKLQNGQVNLAHVDGRNPDQADGVTINAPKAETEVSTPIPKISLDNPSL
jgi:hypothetical protein